MIKQYDCSQLEIALFQEAKVGKSFCGDGHIVIERNDYIICAVIDGLGSGEWASHSTEAAISVIKSEHDKPVEQIVEACNKALLNKRGAVLTVVKVVFNQKELRYCNVGNIGFALYQPDGKVIKPIPKRGYLSGRIQTIASIGYPIQRGSVFVMYSDGVKSPPANELLLKMESPKKLINQFTDKNDLVVKDDMTLLIGKFK